MKVKDTRPIYEIEVNDVFYLYAVGLQWIAISTKPDSQWGELPEWCKIECGAETPPILQTICRNSFFPGIETENYVRRIIKEKIHEQRKAYESQTGNNKHLAKHPDQPKQETALQDPDRKRRKAVTLELSFERDNEAIK